MTSSIEIPSFDLPGEVSIPQFGLGVFQVPPEDTTENVLQAIEMGYRHIDTAKGYGNEAEVGQAVRASGLDRSEFFITTKCANDDHGYDAATRALKTSLGQLEMEYVDLYLIHWPVPSQDRYVETWRALIEAQEAGPRPRHRRLELPARPPAADHRRDRRHPGGEPDRAAPLPAAGRPAPRARRPRHRHRGLEPARAGPGARRPGHHRDRRGARQDRRAGRAALAHRARQRGVPEVGHRPSGSRRTSTSSTSTLSATEMEQLEAVDRGERIGPDPDVF